MLDAAIELRAAGMSVIPVRADGSKAPAVDWKPYTQTAATVEQIRAWFHSGNYGLGVVCGAVSGNLEMVEVEGRAADRMPELAELANASGLGDLWQTLVTSWFERSPSNGWHFLYRVDGEIAGNTKLARAADGKTVLAETRGENGMVVVAPTPGTHHETGRPWERALGGPGTVATITIEQRDALHDLVRMLDLTPQPSEPVTRPSGPIAQANAASGHHSPAAGLSPGDAYEAQTDWAEILLPHGWTLVHTQGQVRYWRRPGKTIGVSATTGKATDRDRLYVFSTSTEFDSEKPYTKFGAITVLEHGGDHKAAAAALRRQGFGDQPDPARPVNGTPRADTITIPRTSTTPQLPDDLWAARPALQHIHQAARSRLVSPDALLGAVLARISTLTNHAIHLPETPRRGSLNIIIALTGHSGDGKGAAIDLATRLLPHHRPCGCGDDDHPGDYITVPAGSGEGLVRNYYDHVTDKDDDGKKQSAFKIDRRHILVRIDEGEALSKLAARQGQTTMQILRQAWSGEELGFSYSTAEKNLRLPAHGYRVAVVLGIQPTLAGPLFDDVAGGTPQRFLWLGLADTGVPDTAPDWPGPLEPVNIEANRQQWTAEMRVDTSITAEITAARRGKIAGRIQVDPLDTHRDLSRLKTAALLARMEQRLNITQEDWQIAGCILDTSDNVRDWVRDQIAHDTAHRRDQAALAAAHRAVVVDSEVSKHAAGRVADRLLAKLNGEWVPRAELRRTLASRDRDHFDDAVDALLIRKAIDARDHDYKGQNGVEYRAVQGSK